ncbi:MAG: type I polyketide synthase, partial [Mycobacterium sp.]
ADADGIGRGEGVGTVVLRRLDDAVKAGQPIYAVVKSSVTNHDGRSNGITAPSRRSQAALMQRALALAEVDAGQIDFIEAHGTGTVLGDMIEANALGDVHGHGRREPCLLGSVKGNIGHTEGSAGIAAFIKVCLALHHRIVPPTVFGDEANAALRLDERGLRLADVPHDLPGPALGAVSSFGLGGSNAHAVLESAPVPSVPTDGRHGVLTVTAPSTEALRLNAAPLAAALDLVAPAEVAAWCDATSAVKRGRRHRLAVSGDRTALADQLRQFAAGGRDDLASSAPRSQKPAGIGLLFSGQGTQYQAMTKRLYDSNPAYRDELEATVATVQPHLEADLLTAVLGGDAAVNHTSLAQPALFAVSYALGRTLCRGGVRAAYGIGHSVGEIAAACTAGVLSLEDAAALVVARGRMMGSLATGGAMIAVDLDEEAAHRLVAGEPDCVIAAFNAPRSLTLSGPADAVARLKSSVLAHGYNAIDLPVSHAFHSPLMKPAVADFRSEIAGLKPRAARFPLFSTMLGSQIRGEEMTADYWAEQICAPVRFADAVRAALRGATVDYLAEAGPKASLLTLARKCGVSPTVATLPLCTGPGSTGGEFNDVAAILMRDGYSPDPTTWHGVAAHMQHVPSYQFDRNHRFWSESISQSSDFGTPAGDDTVSTMTHGESQQAVLAVIADVGGYPVAAMNRSSRLAEDLGYDSLLQLRLLDRLRSEYPALQSVSVADVLPHIYTIGQLVDFVLLRLREEETSR